MYFLQIKRLRIEIEKLQWLHQQELSEMKHNLGEKMIINELEKIVFPSKKKKKNPKVSQVVCIVVSACVVLHRANDGGDEAESGAGEGEVAV